MPDQKDKDEQVTTPLGDAQRITPFGTPPPAGGTPSPDLPDASLRPLRQRYDILAEVGRGGMGIVYRARDRETGDVVALKVLRPEIAARPEVIERFKSELLLARKITHKNVCRTYELLRFGDSVAIAMEYVEGESLRSLLKRVEGLSVRQGLKILRQMIAGLAEAHAQGVVHRDLKPENIVITRDGNVKVMDFGIARSLEAEATQTSSIVGTPAYMSPEQAEGKPVDARTDVYALGLIMYEMFTGQPTFAAETPVGFAYKQVHEKPAPVHSLDPYLPPLVERAIEKCLEKDPKKRFQSVAELEAALEEQALPELTEGEPVPAPHLSVWGKRDWALLVLGVLSLIYFLEFRNTVFPAATKPLEVDAISARRAAEELAAKLGSPFRGTAGTSLQYRGELYWDAFFPGASTKLVRRTPSELLKVYHPAGLPVYWKIEYTNPADDSFSVSAPPPDRYAFVDRGGRVEELANYYPAGWTFPNYQAPPIEQRRAIAKRAAELACGSLPANPVLVELSGGEQGASYAVHIRPSVPSGSPPVASVSLLAENVVSVSCDPEPKAWGAFDFVVTTPLFGDFHRIMQLFLLLVLVGMMVQFGVGQCYRSPVLWRRVPLALVLGVAGVWLVAPTFDQPLHSPIANPTPSLVALFGGGLAVAALVLVALVTSEHYLTRRIPAWIATYLLAWRGRFRERALGLAVLRGALAGLLLAAVDTLAHHLTLAFGGGTSKLSQFVGDALFSPASPTDVGQAIASFSPALFVTSAAVFNGVLFGLVFMGWGCARAIYKEFRKYQNQKAHQLTILMGMGMVMMFATFALRSPLGHALGIGLTSMFLPWALGFLVACLLVLYDVLTVIVAVGTAVLWLLNYPLLQILQNLGNAGQWAVFIGWGVLVAAGAAVGFRSELARARERWKAEMQ
jgi:hypothetical protein